MAIYTLEEYAQLKKKKKKENGIENAITLEENMKRKGISLDTLSSGIAPISSDIAPIGTTVSKKDEEEKERKWFQKGAFKDGYQFGDVTKTILGSGADLLENVGTGILGMGEKTVDALAYLSPAMTVSQQAQNSVAYEFDIDEYRKMQDDSANFIKKDLYSEEDIAKKIITKPAKKIGIDAENQSVFGEKSDSLMQSAGQLGATIGLQAVGVPWWLTTGSTSFGGEVETAFKDDATYGQAGGSALISAGAEILTEKLSGGIKFGGTTLDDVLLKPLTEKIANKTVRTITNLGLDAVGEGTEEVITSVISNLGTSLYKEESIGELLTSEEALDEYIESFIGGAVLGGGVSAITTAIESKNEKPKYTANEETVIAKEVENRITELETDGTKLDKKTKSEIEKQVKKDLEKGYINIDTIESALGGETYNQYKSITEQEETLTKQLEELKNAPNTVGNAKLYEETENKLAELKKNSNKTQIKEQLSKEVQELTKSDLLIESYNEKARRSQVYEADLTKYDEKQQAVIKKAVESGILNNTNKTHEFVDMIARISADKGVSFDFTNNTKLKDSGFAIEGKTVNGYVKDGNIAVNIDSNKALNTVVGHEITHVLEGTELYTELQNVVKEYATTKGEYDTRYKALEELYKDVDGAVIENELTADLVGEYLFTDSDFINSLSTTKPNVFKKIYDEIKYLYKLATAGSKEARQLEKVKRAFDKAYKESKTAEADTKYSVTDKNIKVEVNDFHSGEMFATMSYTQDGKVVGTLEYSEYEGEPNVKMIEVSPEYRRKGIGKKLLQELQRKYPDVEINYGMTTPDGTKLLENATYTVEDTELAKKFARLEEAERKIAEYDEGYNNYFENDLEIPENYAEDYNDLLDEIYELKTELRGKKKTKTFVKTDTRYSLSEDSNGNEISPAVQKRFANSKAVDENGSLKVLYHGTPSGEFYTFDKSKGSIEGDFGSGFYFTDNEADVEKNYEGGGPDFENKVSRRAEQIEAEEDIDYDEAEQRAREELYKGSNKFEVYLNIENPAIVGETTLLNQEDFLDQYNEEDFDDYDDYIAEVEQFVADEIENIVWEVEKNVDLYSTDGIADVLFNAYYEGGIGIEDLKAQINELYLEDNEGNLAGNEVTRQIIESLGFDGIIDSTVSDKFRNMGIESGTTHYIVFKPNQIKAITNQNPTDNPDIRYSMGDREVAPTGNYNVYGKDIALETPENAEKVDLTPSNGEKISESAPKNAVFEDYAPLTEEEANELDTMQGERLATINDSDMPEEVEVPVDEMQVLYSLEAQQQEKIAELDSVVETEDSIEATTLPTVESYDAKLENYKTALEGYKTARATIETSFDDVINKKTAEYNALKRKDTKKATTLLMQIENMKLRKSNNIATLDSKISKVESTIDKMSNGIPTKRQIYHRNIVDKIKDTFSKKGFDFDKILENAKNKGTFSSVDNTPQRFIEKSLGYKEGQILNDLTINKVAQNESKAIQWLNSYTDKKDGLLAQISKEYGIKPRSKESASAQMYAEGFYVDDDGTFVKYGDEELAKDYPNAKVRENIKKLAKDERVRKIYDDTLKMINESRKRNLYPEIPRRNNYFLHFREMGDTFSRLGIPFNPNDIRLKDLPTDINGMTADLKPGQPYFASAKQRRGYKTTYDLVGGVERYLNSAKNQIYHIDDIQTLRALRNYIADTYGQAKGLESLDSMTEEEAVARIEEVYNSHLSTFAKFLNEEANILAGKTSLTDRGLEGVIGRRGIQFLDTVNRQVGSNMVGANISSALTNTVSMVQSIAKSNKFDSTKAFAQTVSNQLGSLIGKTDGFVENNPMMIRRKGIEKMTRTPWESITDKGYLLMSAVDNISSEFIVRTKFNELTRKGMSEQQAHIEADKWASRILGDRSLGQQPQLYNSKMLGLITKFQLEVRNQLDSQFYDTWQEAKLSNEEIENRLVRNMKTTAKFGSVFLQLAVLQHIFGQAFESVAGYNPAFDIVEAIAQSFGWDDEEESEDTALDNLEEGFLTLIGDLPYTSTFTGGRIPISSALPVKQFITGKDSYGNEKSRLETFMETAPYYLAPTGYGQWKKTKAGLEMFNEEHPIAGSYTKSGTLRFPVEDTPLNRWQAGIFGQYASENARDYFDNERKPLNAKQIQEYKDLEIPIRDYWEYREGLSGLDKLEEKTEYINSLDLPVAKKNIMINNVTTRKEAIDLTGYDDFSDFEEFDYATKNPEKYEFLQENNISYEEYNASKESKELYNWYYSKPERVTMAKVVAGDLKTYRSYEKEINAFEGDDKKADVKNYIFNLDMDYGQKAILYRSKYGHKDDKNEYDNDIIDYLNSRNDLSDEEKQEIFNGLKW